jgi:predicted PurR-regulated permease PerM
MTIGKEPVLDGDEAPLRASHLSTIKAMLVGIFLFASIYALYFARDFFMPVTLAFLAALTLTPIVRFLRRRGVPEAISATLLVFVSATIIGLLAYAMSGPVVQMVNDAPQIGQRLQDRLEEFREPLDRLMRVSKQVEEVTEAAEEPGVQRVVVTQPGIVSRAAGNLLSGTTTAAIVLVLSIFLLASGTMFYEKIVQSFTKMSEKKRALRVVYDVEREISRYLLTVSMINAALGVAVGTLMWMLGMPMPLVFGVAAALLNFLPYVGAATTVVLVTIFSLVTFDSFAYALVPPAVALMCQMIEGQFITPLIVGRRLEINAVAIFIAVAFWSWLWGFVGALIAVPLLVVIKVFCDHFESLAHVGNFLGAQQTAQEEEDDREEARSVGP